jgi:hypothetical protein
MSSASIWVSSSTSAPPASAAGAASSASSPSIGGATSWARRCRVQSPPRTTSVGTSGSGVIAPTSAPSPVNVNAVT